MSPTIAEPIAGHQGAPLARRELDWREATLNRPAQHNRIDPADIAALSPRPIPPLRGTSAGTGRSPWWRAGRGASSPACRP